eukprot:gb/GEZN01013610.1/.p1 GENE.gb/GEZN01013610.1/~~gb/GEZN01013610.1/.p1  ORF type:complete len:137 (+),score=26.04 gb/GEZN01013610.1/:361-771(+)
MLVDEKRQMYAMLGMGRSVVGAWGPRAIWWYMRNPRKLKGGPTGDPNQMGGDFVIDREGVVLLSHPSRNSTDRPTVEAIKTVVKSNNKTQAVKAVLKTSATQSVVPVLASEPGSIASKLAGLVAIISVVVCFMWMT